MTNTTLINKDNKIKESFYKKVNFIDIKDIDGNDTKIEKETYENYLELQEFLKTKNIIIGIDSAYRSEQRQSELYQEFIERYGKEYADKIVAPVGTSEHHSGLAIDLALKSNNEYLDADMVHEDQEPIYKEVHKHLKDFGFILRYPEGKEHITGYPYEPWHIRYVGKFVAKIIYEKNYTLEEYLTDFSGIILVNKEKDMTSFDVVNEISHLFGIKRVGHTGTLDPLAEGVLLVAIGKATKVVELLTATYKEYIATVKLGIKTDTLDITGKVLEQNEVPNLENLDEVLNSFKKTYLQEVPIYSAVKVNGKKLYEYARNNEQVELPKKTVTIKEIELLDKTEDTFKFKTLVSKGCYIRSLINDIGNELNTYATMTELTRTKQGKVSIEETKTLKDIKNGNFKIYEIDEVLEIPVIVVDSVQEQKIRTGQKINNDYNIKEKVIFKDQNNFILGIYESKEGLLSVWKNFV
ncbi:MAG: tRNA pseudouridine(55) synthase TruB [Bacilli bacterium]|nr:tRNA pseudouridine(55) synthase TruB [Bacilli bacterium]